MVADIAAGVATRDAGRSRRQLKTNQETLVALAKTHQLT
jgi:hypothetical protein